MKVHTIVFGTRLVFHEVATVFRRSERRFQGPPIDVDVVDSLDCSQGILGPKIRDISTRTRALKYERTQYSDNPFILSANVYISRSEPELVMVNALVNLARACETSTNVLTLILHKTS